jgi:hypothetical protein
LHRLFYLIPILFNLIACRPEQSVENTVRNPAGQAKLDVKSKWPNEIFPLHLKYGDNFDTTEISVIESAADAWSDSTQNQFHFFDVSSSFIESKKSLKSYDDQEIGIYKLNQWPKELPPTALAITQIYGNRKNKGSSDEHIAIDHADVLINYANFSYTTDESWGYDLKTVLLHELGHLLGLYHNSYNKDSIMYPSISSSSKVEDLNEDDAQDILKLYTRSSYATSQKDNLDSLLEKRTVIRIELYPNKKEVIKIIQGDKIYESTTHNCSH